MPLDPQTEAVLKRLNEINFVLTRNVTPIQARKRQRALAQFITSSVPEPVAMSEDRYIPGPAEDIQIRIYPAQGHGPFPILIYFHGGGGVIGDLDSDDALCQRLAHMTECIVVSVDYHLAPEHKFPSGPEECYAATCWIAANAASFNGDPARIAIGGMSAGGSLAAVVTHMARDRGGPTLVFQLLLVPVTDFRFPESASLQAYGIGYLLTREDIIWFSEHCLNSEEERSNPLASPSLAATFSGLPPALIITAEYDPLRDDGEHYGNLLQDAGIPVTISRRNGAIHGFLVPYQLELVLAEAAAALRGAFTINT